LFDLKNVGYEPQIQYETGRVTKLILKFGNTSYIIRTQQLTTQTIERPINVTSETVYNNMSDAMTELYKQMFKQTYKSYYTKQDIDILDEYRTVVNCGIFPTSRTEALVEIDITKAFTSSLTDISRILIFNEFDTFQPFFAGEDIQNNNLYIIKTKTFTLFFNKTYNLCYGEFLLQDANLCKDIEILAYKRPSSTATINYKSMINNLYNTKISDDPDEDIYIKKLIANSNIGLLEKSTNKRQASYIF